MNKKAQSDTAVILFILVFQAFLIISLGFLNIDTTEEEVGTDSLGVVGLITPSFNQNVINNIEQLGVWNTLIFAPLIIVLIYIIAKLVRGGG